MPTHTVWVDPEHFLTHNGVEVYHTYRDNDADQKVNRFVFTLNPNCGIDESQCEDEPCLHAFDCRRLSTWQPVRQPPYCIGRHDNPENRAAWDRYWADELAAIKLSITAAIEKNELPLKAPQEPLPE